MFGRSPAAIVIWLRRKLIYSHFGVVDGRSGSAARVWRADLTENVSNPSGVKTLNTLLNDSAHFDPITIQYWQFANRRKRASSNLSIQAIANLKRVILSVIWRLAKSIRRFSRFLSRFAVRGLGRWNVRRRKP